MRELTQRQRQCVALLTYTNQQIGQILGISERTVRNTLGAAARALGVPGQNGISGNRTRLLMTALRKGAVSLEDVSVGDVRID